MSKKDFLQQKYEEINKLKSLFQEAPKEHIDTVLKSINKACDDVSKYLYKKSSKTKVKVEEVIEKADKKKTKHKDSKNHDKNNKQTFTVKELEVFNGKDGKAAYIAIDGVVYDVSGIKKWKNGKHHGIVAGQVLTEEYKKFHKDKLEFIKKAKVVGVLIEKKRELTFTKDELSKYNGRNGVPAYVALDGIVYDVSKILKWKYGSHYGLMAGQDLSAYYKGCHSDNLDIIKNAIEVGRLVTDNTGLSTYTIAELAKYDGVQSTLSYVAINGIVYDVTNVATWGKGNHYGIMAGKDLTEYFNECHKTEKEILEKLTVVGKLQG